MLSEQSRAREEAEKRLNKLMKNLDHLERARREEEAPLLEANHTKQARACILTVWYWHKNRDKWLVS